MTACGILNGLIENDITVKNIYLIQIAGYDRFEKMKDILQDINYEKFIKSIPPSTETFFINRNDFNPVQIESFYSGATEPVVPVRLNQPVLFRPAVVVLIQCKFPGCFQQPAPGPGAVRIGQFSLVKEFPVVNHNKRVHILRQGIGFAVDRGLGAVEIHSEHNILM